MAGTLAVLLLDSQAPKTLVPKAWTVHRKPEEVKVRNAASLFVLVQSSWLERVSDVIKEAQAVHKLSGVIVRNDVALPDLLLSEFWYAKLRSLKNALIHNDFSIPRRILNAWTIGAQRQLIALATVENGVLYLRDCALERFALEKGSLALFGQMTEDQFERFEIASGGEYIHWPSHDVHLDVNAVRAINNPAEEERQRAVSLLYSQDFGAAVKCLRNQYKLRQSQMNGVSERELRRIESGASVPHTSSLRKLAAGHGVEYRQYLDELAEVLYKLRNE
jgi:hypothetical protein